MALPGKKPNEKSVTRHKPSVDWTEVIDKPYVGSFPELPKSRTYINPKGEAAEIPIEKRTIAWYKAITSMPHCVLWHPSDWQFALDTAMVHASASHGSVSAMGELRQREKIMGTTVDARRDLRIRYVDEELEQLKVVPIASIEDRRTRLLDA